MAEDDPSIGDESLLYRRIVPEWIVPGKDGGEPRISSQGFTNKSMSVNVGPCIDANGHELPDLLRKYPACSLAAVPAGLARREGQAVFYEEAQGEICHGLVEGKKTRSVARQLAHAANRNWVIRPK